MFASKIYFRLCHSHDEILSLRRRYKERRFDVIGILPTCGEGGINLLNGKDGLITPVDPCGGQSAMMFLKNLMDDLLNNRGLIHILGAKVIICQNFFDNLTVFLQFNKKSTRKSRQSSLIDHSSRKLCQIQVPLTFALRYIFRAF